jgi:hypothetical protein
MCDKWNKMKDKYEVENKKNQATRTSPIIGHSGIKGLIICLEKQPILMVCPRQLTTRCILHILNSNSNDE